MNKTYLIAGGASVASLAVGAAGGYLYAKKRFDATVDGLIALEVAKTKKYFSVQLLEAEKKAQSAQNLVVEEDEPLELEGEDHDEVVDEKSRKIINNGHQALVNYQGYAEKPALSDLVESNIFTKDASPKKKLPPRDPTGKFVPKQEKKSSTPELTPYIIDEDTFLKNDPEFDQESVHYFINDDTALMVHDYSEVVDNARIGEVNLTLFPDEEPSVIYVRNEGLHIDYQITRLEESLTVAMGLGEDEADLEDAY